MRIVKFSELLPRFREDPTASATAVLLVFEWSRIQQLAGVIRYVEEERKKHEEEQCMETNEESSPPVVYYYVECREGLFQNATAHYRIERFGLDESMVWEWPALRDDSGPWTLGRVRAMVKYGRDALYVPDILWNVNQIQKRAIGLKLELPTLSLRAIRAQVAFELEEPIQEIQLTIEELSNGPCWVLKDGQELGGLYVEGLTKAERLVLGRFEYGESPGPRLAAYMDEAAQREYLLGRGRMPIAHPPPQSRFLSPRTGTLIPRESYAEAWFQEKKAVCLEYYRRYCGESLHIQKMQTFLMAINLRREIVHPFTKERKRFFIDEEESERRMRLEGEFGETLAPLLQRLPIELLGGVTSTTGPYKYPEEIYEQQWVTKDPEL